MAPRHGSDGPASPPVDLSFAFVTAAEATAPGDELIARPVHPPKSGDTSSPAATAARKVSIAAITSWEEPPSRREEIYRTQKRGIEYAGLVLSHIITCVTRQDESGGGWAR